MLLLPPAHLLRRFAWKQPLFQQYIFPLHEALRHQAAALPQLASNKHRVATAACARLCSLRVQDES